MFCLKINYQRLK